MSQRTRRGRAASAQRPAHFDPGISSQRSRDRWARSMFEMFIALLFVTLNDWRQPRRPSVGQWLKSGAAQPKHGMVCDHRKGGDRSTCIVVSPGKEAEPNVQDRSIVHKGLEPRALVAHKHVEFIKRGKCIGRLGAARLILS